VKVETDKQPINHYSDFFVSCFKCKANLRLQFRQEMVGRHSWWKSNDSPPSTKSINSFSLIWSEMSSTKNQEH